MWSATEEGAKGEGEVCGGWCWWCRGCGEERAVERVEKGVAGAEGEEDDSWADVFAVGASVE